jgi:iron complex transport system ATP-binding protein
MLEVDRLCVRYGERIAVSGVTFAAAPGGLVALLGPNGAGKSSLLKAIAGVCSAEGRIAWEGRQLDARAGRRRGRVMAYLPQSPVAHWPLSVRDLVALGRLPHRRFGRPAGVGDRDAVEWAMTEARIGDLADRSAADLSGGERARVQLARALTVQAPVLLVDEPVTSLDPYHQLEIMHVLERYAARQALVIAVLHDLTLAARFCARVLLLHDGALVADGPPAEVLSAPALRRYYRVDPFLASRDGQAVVVPWQRVD